MGQDSDTTRLTQDIERTRGDLSRDVDALADKVSPGRVVNRRVRSTRSGLSRLRDNVMGPSQQASGSVSDKASAVKDGVASGASSATDTVRQQAQGNPLAAGLVAFGVGWLVSSLVPASEKEVRASQKLEDTAKEHGRPVADAAKDVGSQVGGAVKEKATEAAQDLKGSAQESAARVKDEGSSSASSVADEARAGSPHDAQGDTRY
jgi:gas vesicle protein